MPKTHPEFDNLLMVVPGDRVVVYHDPITQEHAEGRATLLAFKRDGYNGQQYWSVLFEGDTEPVLRWIYGIYPKEAGA